jgi:hypothetical protein
VKYIVVAIAVVVLCLCGTAYAEQTGRTLWHSHSYTDQVGAADKYSEYQKKQDMALGIGIDTILYEFDGDLKYKWCLESVNTEYKYDIANGNQSTYGVVHVNAWRAVKNILK